MSIKKKWIGNEQIDGSKILLLNDQALSAKNAAGSKVDVLKIDENDKLQLLVAPNVSADPASDNELARKGYVDQAAADAASGAIGPIEERVAALEEKHPIDLTSDVSGILPAANGGTGREDFPAMQLLFGAPDGLSIDRSEFLTYDASIGLLINQGGQMQTRTLEQGANDPSATVIADKVEVGANDVDGATHTRMNKDYVQARKVLSDKEFNASMGFDGANSWMGVSKTTNEGNNIAMVKLFCDKAQLFTVDIAAGTGPQPVDPVDPIDLTSKHYVDAEVGEIGSQLDGINETLGEKLDASEVGVSVASLVDGKIPTEQLPALAITETFVVASQSAMLALDAQPGDIAIRTDLSKSFILADIGASTLSNWKELLTPADAVSSVNGQTGAVSLDSDDISEGSANLYFTDARAKAAAAAQQKHERIVLSATDISNGYIDLAYDVIGVPMVINGPSRIPLLPTDDFTVSGARITWNSATVGAMGEEALVEGEIIHVFYMGE